MVVSGALVWCQRDGQLLPLRLDSIKLSGALTEAHWDSVTHFLEMVATQRLVIQDVGMFIQSTSQSPVTDGIQKFNDSFVNLVQEQKCHEKYSRSDYDGTRPKGGFVQLSEVQKCSAEEEVHWPREQQNIHVEIKEQLSFNNETEIMNTNVLKNFVEKSHEVVLDSECNPEQRLAQKFGMFSHDVEWKPETCEDRRKVVTVPKCGQQQRRRKIRYVTEDLDAQYIPQELKQKMNRMEEIVAVLNCQECEQTRHMSSERGGIPPRASTNLQHKQVSSETVADVNSNVRVCAARQALGVDQKCRVEFLHRAIDCQGQPIHHHRTVCDNSSESFVDKECSCQEELSKCYPLWQITREHRGCSSERTYYQSFICQMSERPCVNWTKHGIPHESVEHGCSCVNQSNETNIGNLSSAQESAGNLRIRNQRQQVCADCERCELELLSQAVVQIADGDEGIKRILTQPQIPGQDVMSSCYSCPLEQEHLKVRNQNRFHNSNEFTTLCQKCQPQCSLLCHIHSYRHNACLVNNSVQAQIVSCDRHFTDEEKTQSIHKSIHIPHTNHYGNEQKTLQGYGWCQCVRSPSPVSAEMLPICHAKASVCHHSRISKSGTPMDGPTQSKGQENSPIWQQCELEQRNFQICTPVRNEVCMKCREGTRGFQECELQKQTKSQEEGEGMACKLCQLEERVPQRGTPEGTKIRVNWQENTSGCLECELQKQIFQGTWFQKCEFGKRALENVTPERNNVRFRCQERVLEEQEVTPPDVDEVSCCRQVAAAGVEYGSHEAPSECNKAQRTIPCEWFHQQYREGLEERGHHKKKRAAARWQRLLRKHATTSVRRKPLSVAAAHPGP
jgi:hypothetical protein